MPRDKFQVCLCGSWHVEKKPHKTEPKRHDYRCKVCRATWHAISGTIVVYPTRGIIRRKKAAQ